MSGTPHHVTQRGNNAQDVFFVDDDRQFYLRALKAQCEKLGVELLGYCLMSNHVHLVLLPGKADDLARAVGRTHFRYSQYINKFHGRTGHLWQGRFYSCALDEPHFMAALRYIEQNPVRAKIVREAWKYPWSSATAHVEGRDRANLLSMRCWSALTNAAEWRGLLRNRMDQHSVEQVGRAPERGWPLAGDRWLAKMERLAGRRLRPLPAHRPVGARDRKQRTRRKKSQL